MLKARIHRTPKYLSGDFSSSACSINDVHTGIGKTHWYSSIAREHLMDGLGKEGRERQRGCRAIMPFYPRGEREQKIIRSVFTSALLAMSSHIRRREHSHDFLNGILESAWQFIGCKKGTDPLEISWKWRESACQSLTTGER